MGEDHQAVFGVFDGHAGSRASQYCQDTFKPKLIERQSELKTDTGLTIQKGKIIWLSSFSYSRNWH